MTTVMDLQRFKAERRRFAMLTAYDYPTARMAEEAGIPVLLVGDSLGNVVLGYPTTVFVTLEDVLHHARAVARGASSALLVGDLPFMSYQPSLERAITSAGRLVQEGGMHAVKLEGAGPSLEVVRRLTQIGIPVMAHLGLTPQSVHALGGFRVQARTEEAAERLLQDACELEAAGAFSLVLEAVPAEVAERVTAALRIPTIGIGAGPHCDGQVLVAHDLLGLTRGRTPRFVKRYADLGDQAVEAMRAFAREVAEGTFPGPEHSYRGDAGGRGDGGG
ncbi:MAG TPA: 3-methyl-2-oxobutanoate hydroxymethyltransferase [Candidatus Dormibacteraeota bacterium]|nr:3-methyl-2-oxobutanoate hydroxymethyltransferase [Candidatus Dormibacteraeota bacterium]